MSDAITNPLEHRYVPPATIDSYQCRRIYIPDHEQFRSAINELLSRLMIREVWEATPFTMSADDAATLAGDMLVKFWRDDCMLGTIMPHVRAALPEWALPCDGSTHNRTDYPDLYAMLASEFIVDADSFITPDLTGRVIMADGDTDHAIFSTGGVYRHTLTTSEMPTHDHTVAPHNHGITTYINIPVPAGVDPVFASSMVDTPGATANDFGQTTSAAGAGADHTNTQPYFVMPYLIVAK